MNLREKKLIEQNQKFYDILNELLEEVDRCVEKKIPFVCMNKVYINAVEVLIEYEDELHKESGEKL